MSARLDVLCPHSSLCPMVVYRKTYILMFFVIVMCYIHHETFEMLNLSASPAPIPEVFATPFILVNLCRIGKVRWSRNLLDPFTDLGPLWHSLLESILLSTRLVKDLKQTVGVPSVTRFTALKITKKPGYPYWMSNESTWFRGKCTLFYSCFVNCRRLSFKNSAYEVCTICPKLIAACKIHRKSPSRRQDGLTMLDWFMVHEATLSA